MVDQTTRATSGVQATLANAGGNAPAREMFVQTHDRRSAADSLVVLPLPASAINYAPTATSVFVVGDVKDDKGQSYRGVRQQFVKLGRRARRPGCRSSPGSSRATEVVTSGVFKLRNGAAVLVNNEMQPANEPPRRSRENRLDVKFTDLFVKRPVLAHRRQPRDPDRGAAVDPLAQRPPVSRERHRGRQRRRPPTSARTPTSCAASSRTPLERVIASADGIDYMESSSAQGLSTITVHLKLNYDTNAALTQIQAKVAQVRNDLPPEAEAPVIELRDRGHAVRRDVPRLLLRASSTRTRSPTT